MGRLLCTHMLLYDQPATQLILFNQVTLIRYIYDQ